MVARLAEDYSDLVMHLRNPKNLLCVEGQSFSDGNRVIPVSERGEGTVPSGQKGSERTRSELSMKVSLIDYLLICDRLRFEGTRYSDKASEVCASDGFPPVLRFRLRAAWCAHVPAVQR